MCLRFPQKLKIFGGPIIKQVNIIFPYILESGRELVADDLRESFTEFKEEFLAGFVLVGKHMEIETTEGFNILILEERGTRYGNRLPTG